jgi:hypothetical protein
MSNSKLSSRRGCWLLLIPLIILIALSGFYVWASVVPAPMPQAIAALQSDAQVTVTTTRWLVFIPADKQPTTGLVFYPGGKVDARAYAPLAHNLAAAGYLVVIPPMPLHLAVFAPDVALSIEAAYPAVTHWVVGGHSLGGSMAAQFVFNHPDKVQGLVLFASYPGNNNSLANFTLKVVSVSGSLDGLATPAKIEASRPLLPAGTTWVVIQGGNHGQFGWYGDQSGDHPASISREEQQAQAEAAVLELLKSIEQNPQ